MGGGSAPAAGGCGAGDDECSRGAAARTGQVWFGAWRALETPEMKGVEAAHGGAGGVHAAQEEHATVQQQTQMALAQAADGACQRSLRWRGRRGAQEGGCRRIRRRRRKRSGPDCSTSSPCGASHDRSPPCTSAEPTYFHFSASSLRATARPATAVPTARLSSVSTNSA